MSMEWKKGRGKRGPLHPLVGRWRYTGDSPMGPVDCTRHFAWDLNNQWLVLDATWIGTGKGGSDYIERCYFGVLRDGALGFVSFINDGTQSQGTLTDVSDIHPKAVGFQAEMPAGIARQCYWPHGDGGLGWRVEREVKSGWSTLVEHRYDRVD